MKTRFQAILSAVAFLSLTPIAVGAEDNPVVSSAASFIAWLIFISPAMVIFLFAVLYIRKSSAKNAHYMARAGEHMVSIERKTDRMIALLESIDRKLGEGD